MIIRSERAGFPCFGSCLSSREQEKESLFLFQFTRVRWNSLDRKIPEKAEVDGGGFMEEVIRVTIVVVLTRPQQQHSMGR
jgi:hypothetical protein